MSAFVLICIISCSSFTGIMQTVVAFFGVFLMLIASTLRSISLIQINKLPQVTILGATYKRFRRNLIWTSIAVGFAILFIWVRSDLSSLYKFVGFGFWPFLTVIGIYLIESVLPLSRWHCVVVGSAMITKDKKEIKLKSSMQVESLNLDAALVSDGDAAFRLWITNEDVEKLKLIIAALQKNQDT